MDSPFKGERKFKFLPQIKLILITQLAACKFNFLNTLIRIKLKDPYNQEGKIICRQNLETIHLAPTQFCDTCILQGTMIYNSLIALEFKFDKTLPDITIN